MNYYNEFDPFAAAWLKELIKEGLIPNGEVDERSITEVVASDIGGFTQCHFFAGIGGWSYALQLAGWGSDRPVWTGSPPCQPFSAAGNRKGQEDVRHLWPIFFNLIRECQPTAVFGEQVATAISHEWFDDLQADMEAENYATGMVVLPACSVGAPHKRNRLYFFADPIRDQQPREESCGRAVGRMGWEQQPVPWDTSWESALARFRIVDDGLPRSVATTDAARNSIVPQVAAQVVRAYMEVVS